VNLALADLFVRPIVPLSPISLLSISASCFCFDCSSASPTIRQASFNKREHIFMLLLVQPIYSVRSRRYESCLAIRISAIELVVYFFHTLIKFVSPDFLRCSRSLESGGAILYWR
jgi:hypothetical protein